MRPCDKYSLNRRIEGGFFIGGHLLRINARRLRGLSEERFRRRLVTHLFIPTFPQFNYKVWTNVGIGFGLS